MVRIRVIKRGWPRKGWESLERVREGCQGRMVGMGVKDDMPGL
jgi:hypothetical protein